MTNILDNIILLFRKPIKLFAKLKEAPDLKGSFAIIVFVIFLSQLLGIKTGRIDTTLLFPVLIALFVSFLYGLATLYVGIILHSFYIILVCLIFSKKINFKAIVSSLIYCRIPLVFGIITQFIYFGNLGLDSLLTTNNIHPFLKILYHRIEIFELWISILEIIAIHAITDLNYRKSTIIILSSWLISIMLSYFLGLKYKVGFF
jgi:hypothetical protein